MAEQGRRRFADVRRFEELDSTNAWLVREAGRGLDEGVVVVADRQRAGRGRLGRRWESPGGSGLLVSILFRPRIDPADLFSFSALVALAARDACAQVAGVEPGAKWPNDLVVGEAKLAGVLSEVAGLGSEAMAVVVGIGINVSWPMPGPQADELRATCLDAVSDRRPIDRDALLGALLAGVERRRPRLDAERGRAETVDELARCTVTLGRPVRVDLADETFLGVALGLDERGRLVVEADGCQRVVAAGDVVHVR